MKKEQCTKALTIPIESAVIEVLFFCVPRYGLGVTYVHFNRLKLFLFPF